MNHTSDLTGREILIGGQFQACEAIARFFLIHLKQKTVNIEESTTI
jgi:hypothetical protein